MEVTKSLTVTVANSMCINEGDEDRISIRLSDLGNSNPTSSVRPINL